MEWIIIGYIFMMICSFVAHEITNVDGCEPTHKKIIMSFIWPFVITTLLIAKLYDQ